MKVRHLVFAAGVGITSLALLYGCGSRGNDLKDLGQINIGGVSYIVKGRPTHQRLTSTGAMEATDRKQKGEDLFIYEVNKQGTPESVSYATYFNELGGVVVLEEGPLRYSDKGTIEDTVAELNALMRNQRK